MVNVESILFRFVNVVQHRSYPTHYERFLWTQVVPNVVERILKHVANNDLIAGAAYLRLLLELTFQFRYFMDKFGHDESKIRMVLARRSKSAQSFSIRMVTDMKNVPGPIKKEMLRTYLEVAELVHPSQTTFIILGGGQTNVSVEELTSRVLDIVLYIYLQAYGRDEELCQLCQDANLTRCSKYCRRG